MKKSRFTDSQIVAIPSTFGVDRLGTWISRSSGAHSALNNIDLGAFVFLGRYKPVCSVLLIMALTESQLTSLAIALPN
ncbi:hypothetical protein I2494_05305 [Budviciaceae bacterium BWR-B9]|uniref:Uncharacterized protein n=1 Tax=Limnobaculum allomyrinae TaxID=2791986 RepID=A0ABS1IN12_9GAMM|nr:MULTISPECIES: hypothetical protein [Limnobaculum]MBK5143135.1 hypothetical protein [Limnobaculum allomyrinae]MBV7691024.1 hypothetical protein [Limnobaculum sp. M2-1]